MKQILVFFLLLTFAPILFSVNITTLDGTVYKNAQVVNKMPDGILISFVGENDFDTVKLVKFKDLPADIQKKYGYDAEKANKYEKEHQKWLDEQYSIVEERKLAAEKSSKLHKENSIKELEHINTGEAETSLDDIGKSTTLSQDKAKLNDLMNRLDDASSTTKNQANTTGTSSISGLVHDMVSSTEDQVKEINKLTTDKDTD